MRVNFAFDSDEITPMAQRALEQFSSELTDAEQKMIVEGHTDAIGTEEYNQGLGLEEPIKRRKYSNRREYLVKISL
ncbi:hypothetical protein JCM19236_3962 [Vibrio sp. JCM 19236]|nr:hypothetical protein JCM19236_3962 [Vibrio sp. JCM 19236]